VDGRINIVDVSTKQVATVPTFFEPIKNSGSGQSLGIDRAKWEN